MKIIDNQTLDLLSRDAAASERLRKNLNLHDDYTDPCQRLLNAMEPGTYIRPHRHQHPPKPECFMAVRGKLALVVFSAEGDVEEIIPFGDGCDVVIVDLPAGIWHSLISLQPGSIFFETKPGPYEPLSDKDFAPWAPAEGTSDVASYLANLEDEVRSHE